ncbi:MAG: C4-dicarboxylate ABC transporter, partial [Candidatus Micropelagos thuwalensis]
VMFTIPFVFAIYPELLLIDKAVMDPVSGLFLEGYDGTIQYGWLAVLILRITFALYLVASALAGYDRKALTSIEIIVRLAIAVLVLSKPMEIYAVAIVAGIAVMGIHVFRNKEVAQT